MKSEDRRKKFEVHWNEVKERMLKKLDEGTFKGPIVPIGLRPPEPRKVKIEPVEVAEVKAKTYLSIAGEVAEKAVDSTLVLL